MGQLIKINKVDSKQPMFVSTFKGFGQYVSVDLQDGWMDLCCWCPSYRFLTQWFLMWDIFKYVLCFRHLGKSF